MVPVLLRPCGLGGTLGPVIAVWNVLVLSMVPLSDLALLRGTERHKEAQGDTRRQRKEAEKKEGGMKKRRARINKKIVCDKIR